jgi:hypothetical protein
VARERYLPAVVLSALNLLALRVLSPLKLKLDERKERPAKVRDPL